MEQFKIIDRVGLAPYRWVVETDRGIVLCFLSGEKMKNKLKRGPRKKQKVGDFVSWNDMTVSYSVTQEINHKGKIEYDDSLPF